MVHVNEMRWSLSGLVARHQRRPLISRRLAIPSVAHHTGALPTDGQHEHDRHWRRDDRTRGMNQMRAVLIDDMRHTTTADAKGNRKMLLVALPGDSMAYAKGVIVGSDVQSIIYDTSGLTSHSAGVGFSQSHP
jgi:hypothetical protein